MFDLTRCDLAVVLLKWIQITVGCVSKCQRKELDSRAVGKAS